MRIVNAKHTLVPYTTLFRSCGSITATRSIAVNQSLSNASATASANTICTGQTLILNGTEVGTPTTWSWTGPNSFTSSNQNPSVTISSVNQSGNYIVTATNAC